jgi:hypothetical protein
MYQVIRIQPADWAELEIVKGRHDPIHQGTKEQCEAMLAIFNNPARYYLRKCGRSEVGA